MKNYNSITVRRGGEGDIVERKSLLNHNNDIDHTTDDNPHPQDHLAPPFSSSSSLDHVGDRPSSLLVGSFNLIATIVGGGVLSLPIIFQKCGIAMTTIFMLTSAYMTYMSLIMLCYASRRSGGSSYGEVVRSAFGERMETGVSWLLFVFLLFVIAAYMVLIRDIWTPLVGLILLNKNSNNISGDANEPAAEEEEANGDRLLMIIIILLLPFLFQRSLHALRFNCYIGFGSIMVLCIALCRGGFQRLNLESEQQQVEEDETFTIEFFKVPSLQDVLFSFPIAMLAFLCHFNVLSIQNILNRPTRQRMKSVVSMSIGLSMLVMYFFGLGGYLLFGSSTQGNVLLNIPIARSSDEDFEEYCLFLLGRIGCGMTMILAMPLMVLPCRDALLEVVDVWFHHTHHRSDVGENDSYFWKLLHKLNSNEGLQDATITTEDEIDIIVLRNEGAIDGRNSILIRHEPINRDWVFRNSMIHYGSTLMILVSCYTGATKVDQVAVIWTLLGSSLAFLIAFILPFGCFIVIESNVQGRDKHDGWIKLATVGLILSILGALICTWNRFASM